MLAFPVLRRCAALFGKEFCCLRLQQEQEVMTLFSGIECTRKAWEMVSAAALELWGISTGVRFTCAVAFLRLIGLFMI